MVKKKKSNAGRPIGAKTNPKNKGKSLSIRFTFDDSKQLEDFRKLATKNYMKPTIFLKWITLKHIESELKEKGN